jgi:hypothetical protein
VLSPWRVTVDASPDPVVEEPASAAVVVDDNPKPVGKVVLPEDVTVAEEEDAEDDLSLEIAVLFDHSNLGVFESEESNATVLEPLSR